MDKPLTLDQIAQFRREGFLVIEKPQIAEPELQWCRNILMGLIEKGNGRDEGRNFDLAARDGADNLSSPQMLQPSLYATELRELSYRKTAFALATQLLGPSATFAGDHAILKPSRIGGPTPWHQDEAFRDANFDYDEISIWIALTDTTIENGPMQYIPGSHLLGVLPHRLHGNSNDANSIECYDGFDPSTAAVCPIPAGAMIIHGGRTLHGAPANKSSATRLAYVLQFSTPPTTRAEFREFPWLVNLRKSYQDRRKKSLLRGGIFPELLRIMRSDRDSHKHFISLFIRRRLNTLRNYLRR